MGDLSEYWSQSMELVLNFSRILETEQLWFQLETATRKWSLNRSPKAFLVSNGDQIWMSVSKTASNSALGHLRPKVFLVSNGDHRFQLVSKTEAEIQKFFLSLETEHLNGLKWRPNQNFGLRSNSILRPKTFGLQFYFEAVCHMPRFFSNNETPWRPKSFWSLIETGFGFWSPNLRPASRLVSKDFRFETDKCFGLQNWRPNFLLVSSWDRGIFRSPKSETEIEVGLRQRPLNNFRSPK